jgi:hypothetical protein
MFSPIPMNCIRQGLIRRSIKGSSACPQVWLDKINVNAVRNQGFCLHFISDYQGVTGKALADQYSSTNARNVTSVKIEKIQLEKQYCGNWCILGSSLEPGKPLVVSKHWNLVQPSDQIRSLLYDEGALHRTTMIFE